MTRDRPALSWPRPWRIIVLFLIVPVALACSPNPRLDTQTHTSRRAVRSPESLPIDVLEYTWTFFNHGRHLRLVGLVRNNSDRPYQAVTLKLTLEDERGNVVAKGQTYAHPAYLRPGAEGSFELVSMTILTGRNLPAGRLVTTALTTGY